MKSLLRISMLIIGLFATQIPNAFAVAQLRITDGINTVLVNDDSAQDLSPVPGIINYIGPVGPNWYVRVATGITKPITGTALEPLMDVGSSDYSVDANGVLTVEFTDDGFLTTGLATADFSGLTDGNVKFSTWADAGNVSFAKTTPLTVIGPLGGPSFFQSTTAPLLVAAPYSLTLQVVITHPTPGSSGFDASLYVVGVTNPPTCPNDVTVDCGESLDPETNPKLGKPSIDVPANCAPVDYTFQDTPLSGTNCVNDHITTSITRIWTIVDACNNTNYCTQNITVTDTNSPVFTKCPSDLYLGCNPATIPSCDTTQVEATDNCAIPTITCRSSDRVDGCTVTRTIIYTATDVCGNQATYVQHIVWTSDTVAPIFTKCPNDLNLGCNPLSIPSGDLSQVTATDNCSLTISSSFVDSNDVNSCGKIRTITYTAMDGCGNKSTCVQKVRWTEDKIAPVLTVPTNITIQCGNAPAVGTATATDNCTANPTVVYLGQITNGANCNYTIVRSWKATDGCGNAVTNSQTITVKDTVAPVITCPTNVFVPTASFPKICTAPQSEWGSPCNGLNAATLLFFSFNYVYTNGYVEIGIPGNGGYSVKFTSAFGIFGYLPATGTPGVLTANATNPSSTSSKSFGGEVLALRLNIDFGDAGSEFGYVGSVGDLVLNDPLSPFHGKTVRQILDIANIALGGGNISSYGISISAFSSLLENINKSFDDCTISSWANTYLLPQSVPTSFGVAKATDNCDTNVVVGYTDTTTPGACAGTYVVSRKWTATDKCGNSNFCIQTITFGSTKGSICGTIFRDCNASGSFSDDIGLGGVTVKLKNSAGAVIDTEVTDASGNYCFTDITAGNYTVYVVRPSNYQVTYPVGCDNQVSVKLTACENKTKINFGYTGTAPSLYFKKTGPTTAVCGQTITYTFAVTNTGNTCLYGGVKVIDPMLGGQIFYKTPVVPGQGYTFTVNYTIKATDPTNLVNTATAIGTPPVGNAVTNTSTWTTKVTPCTPCYASICGSVVRDCDASGNLSGDDGLKNITVTLKKGNSTIATTKTDSNGDYCFKDLDAGTYKVITTQPSDYKLTAPSGCDNQQTITVSACQKKTGVDFGYTGTAPSIYFKQTGPTSCKVGNTITLTYAVTNTGNTCFYGGMHVDVPKLGGQIFHKTPVSPGEGFTITKTYTVKSSDSSNISFTATATGHPPTGSAVTVSSDIIVKKQ